MTSLEQRLSRLAYCMRMVKSTQTRIRRLNTSLKMWENRVKGLQKAIAVISEQELISAQQETARLREQLALKQSKPGRRAIALGEEV